jgi:DNA polymerase III delta subunit
VDAACFGANVSKLIVIYGEENFLVERAAREEAALCIPDEIIEYHLPDDLDRYLDDSSIPVIGGGRRVFILWGADAIPILPESDDDTLVVVGGKKPIAHPSAVRTLRFDKLKAYDDNNEVLRWILKEGERYKIDLSRVVGALFVNCGNGLRKLASEIEKLAVLTPPGSQATPDDARSVLVFSAELTPKRIIDSVCEGHTVKALAFYDRLQEQGDETGWILTYMQRHVLQALQADMLREAGVSNDRAAEIVGVHPYIFRKAFRSVWSRTTMTQSFNTLCDLEILHKRGVDVRCGLELEIVNLSEEAHA